ncbi:hypothetical protein M409DRAFT_63852 [Zasmidium cellare ATCC 36951]|uniref:Uncharacterized protein n=1 Tax=Zasmidium cellare ATCC 36951 TaxID=1080233 RepID=A0A6A6CX62_ZASCE|nr:uncharacterized protein M409DRAFT_63852 [Zasmidium cellare ATCC 36951]KAF2170790.1 hypothetical protein M409DRAFT_63852 [Zasmidium cellare ATCC 36951]
MVQVKSYKLPPTTLIPNSPYPLLHYPGLLSGEALKPDQIHEKLAQNGWTTHWIFRYGPTQKSHYHSGAHECMTVLTGTATIRFGVADTTDDLEESTHGSGREQGGIEVQAKAGDVFILPAGTAHKTHDTTPAEFALLTPGKGKGIEAEDPKKALSEIKLDGFCMIGAYPKGSLWDFAEGQENDGHFKEVWATPKPERDPLLGDAKEGLVGLWVDHEAAPKRTSKL